MKVAKPGLQKGTGPRGAAPPAMFQSQGIKVTKQTRTEGNTKAEEIYLESCTTSAFKQCSTLVLLNPSSEYSLDVASYEKSTIGHNLGTPQDAMKPSMYFQV